MLKKPSQLSSDKVVAGDGPHIQWDEDTIAEHDKERGTRQKIDEAPTPYRYSTDEDDEAWNDGESAAAPAEQQGGSILREGGTSPPNFASSPPTRYGDNVMDCWESLHAKLNYEQHQQEAGANMLAGNAANGNNSSTRSAAEAVTVGFEVEPKEGDEQFKHKRAAHYNEFQLMKAMRAKMAREDADEDQDKDEDKDEDEGIEEAVKEGD
jgi:protein phosphatase inhibitor 2